MAVDKVTVWQNKQAYFLAHPIYRLGADHPNPRSGGGAKLKVPPNGSD